MAGGFSGLINGAGGPSLGLGIGLQATVDPRWEQLALEGQRMAQDRVQKQAAAKKKSEDDLKSLGNFKIPVVNPIYQGQLENAVGGLHNELYDLTKKNDPDAFWKGQAAAQKTSEIAAAAQESSKNADIVNQTRYAAANNKNVEPTDFAKKFFEEYDKSVSQKSPTDEFKKIVGNEQGFIPQSVTQQLYQPKEINLTEYAPKYAKALGLTSYKTEKDKGDVFETIGGKGVTPEVVKNDIRQTILAGDPEGKAILSRFGSGVDVNAATEGFYNLVKGKISSSSSQTLTQKQSKESAAQVKTDLATPQQYNAGYTKTGEPVTIESSGGTGFKKPITATISTSMNTINTKDLSQEEGSGVGKSVSLGGIIKVPTYQEDGKTYIVPKGGQAVLKHLGKKISTKNVVVANSTEKQTVLNEKAYNAAMEEYNSLPEDQRGAEPVKSDFEKEAPDTKSYYLPLSGPVRSTLIKNGEGETIKLLEEEDGSTQEAPKEQPKKKDAKHYGL